MSAHTPGPWTSEYTRSGSSLVIQDREGSIIAEVCQWKASVDQSAKDEPPLNAKLLASSPELIDALEGLLLAFEQALVDEWSEPRETWKEGNGWHSDWHRAGLKAIEVIAKVRG